MKLKVYDIEGREAGEIEFSIAGMPVREDLIRRAFHAIMSHARQPYGTDPLAGQRSSAHYHGRRHTRWSMMNREMARLPRIHGKVGYLNYRARIVPHAVKGRLALPPRAERDFSKKINRKERLLALKSAISASFSSDMNAERGHKASTKVVADSFQSLSRTKEVKKALESLGFGEELERAEKKKVRAGKGKMRGRRYRKKKSVLVVADEGSPVLTAAKNIPGVDAVPARRLNVALLAPGGHPGRVCLYTESAIKKIEELWGA